MFPASCGCWLTNASIVWSSIGLTELMDEPIHPRYWFYPHPFYTAAHQNHPHFVSCGIIVTNRGFCICFHSSSPDVWYDRTTQQLTLDFLSSHSEISGGCNLRFLAGFVGFVSRSRRRDTCCRHFSKCWLLAFIRSPYTRWCLKLK